MSYSLSDKGRNECVRVLLKLGANELLNHRGSKGKNALELAQNKKAPNYNSMTDKLVTDY